MAERGSGSRARRSDEPGDETWLGAVGKLMSHPCRISILRALARDDTASPSQAAERVGLALGTTAYHMRTLTALQMVRLKETRPVRGVVEHFYELTEAGEAAVRAMEAVARHAPSR
jgi:predicted ArsR family transcriptional regulator